MSTERANISLFSQVCETDPRHTKNFSRSGGFRGTAISAPWLVKRATETFGPCGIGWGYEIVDEQYRDGADGDVIHVIRLRLWYKWDGQTGEVFHFGQTTFVGSNKNGRYTDEEAPKKSLTDALTKALSMLGFAHDVHVGLFDDNKYVNDLKQRLEEKERSEKPKRPLTEDQQKALVKPVLARVKAGDLSAAVAIMQIHEMRVSDAVKTAAVAKATQLEAARANDTLPEFSSNESDVSQVADT